LGGVVQHPHPNRHAAYYADKNMDSFPRAEIAGAHRQSRAMNNVEAMRSYAAAVSGVTTAWARDGKRCKRLNLDTNTLVVFAADQGMNGGHGGFWASAIIRAR